MPKPKMLTKAAYARHRGCDRSLISRWGRAGRLVMADGLVDVVATDAKLAATRDPRRIGEVRSKIGRGGEDPLRAARIRTEEAQAARQELDLAERQGKLVRLDEAKRAAVEAATAINAAISSMPARTAAALAAALQVDVRPVHTILEEQADELRQVAADAMRALIPAEGAR
jgi:phage terminase Nu1 subunit (DNA packaging protein)